MSEIFSPDTNDLNYAYYPQKDAENPSTHIPRSPNARFVSEVYKVLGESVLSSYTSVMF